MTSNGAVACGGPTPLAVEGEGGWESGSRSTNALEPRLDPSRLCEGEEAKANRATAASVMPAMVAHNIV
jgi:hypothetical protein